MPWVLTRTAVAVAIALLATVTTVATADAASTRAEYVGQAEPMCQAAQKPTVKAYSALFKAIPTAKQDQLNKAVVRRADRALGRFYIRISNIFGLTSAQIAALVPAPADALADSRTGQYPQASRLPSWFQPLGSSSAPSHGVTLSSSTHPQGICW
jgi:hypothetical protein